MAKRLHTQLAKFNFLAPTEDAQGARPSASPTPTLTATATATESRQRQRDINISGKLMSCSSAKRHCTCQGRIKS